MPSLDTKVTKEYKRGYLAGAIYGDGWIGNYMSFKVNDKIFAERVVEYLNYFGTKIQGAKKDVRPKVWRVYTKNKKVLNMLRDNIKNAINYFEKSEEFFRGWMAGYFDAEGTWGKNSRTGISIAQIKDKELQETIVSKLNKLGFNAKLLHYYREMYSTGEIFRVQIYNNRDAFSFFMWCNPILKRKIKFNCRLTQKQKASFAPAGIKKQLLYEIETEEGNYFANNILVHNCSWCHNKVLKGKTSRKVTLLLMF